MDHHKTGDGTNLSDGSLQLNLCDNSVDRAPKFLSFDSDGNVTVSTTTDQTVSSFMSTVLDDTTAAAAATTLGLGTGDTSQFTGIELGNASDTTITRASAGDLNIEENIISRAGGTDVVATDDGYLFLL
jgi:hypothetical protein